MFNCVVFVSLKFHKHFNLEGTVKTISVKMLCSFHELLFYDSFTLVKLWKLSLWLEIDQYIDLADISVSAPVGVDKTLLYSSRIQTTCARKHDKASQDSYLTARLAVAFQKQSDKINHGARVARHSRNKNIIGKFCNVWSYRMQDQVLCTNTLPLYFRKFSQREKFDRNLRCRSPIDAQFSTD